jgi:hypothetical protein
MGEVRAREAVAIADATDALNQCATTRLALADVLGVGGKNAEAAAAQREALALYERKENAVAAAQLRAAAAATATPT